ncbi:c-type cytochrome [Microbulbifer guangxiensis]|uniref:c-type cytochrome n=1 Tax=Microbulbifer guangxiensis TaxID=2904249 RepID=UPI001F031FB1|nr:c-type cytochrome [Microbulbifer guangxiensis]
MLAAEALNLLSSFAADYPDAVQEGQVIDERLYRQQDRQLERVQAVLQALPERPGRTSLERSLNGLKRDFAALRPADLVQRRANAAADRLAALYQLQRAPIHPLPAATDGEPLYRRHCARCHGLRGAGGDGGPSLASAERSVQFSLFDYYNLLDPSADTLHGARLGADLNSWQRWALAVAVARFPVADQLPPSVDLAQRYPALVALPGLAVTRPATLPEDAATALLWWRGYPEAVRTLEHPLVRAGGLLQLAETAYRAGDTSGAYHKAVLAYRQGFLPLRAQLEKRDPALAARILDQWQALREALTGEVNSAVVLAASQRLRESLVLARNRLEPPPEQPAVIVWSAILFTLAAVTGLLWWRRLRRRPPSQ